MHQRNEAVDTAGTPPPPAPRSASAGTQRLVRLCAMPSREARFRLGTAGSVDATSPAVALVRPPARARTGVAPAAAPLERRLAAPFGAVRRSRGMRRACVRGVMAIIESQRGTYQGQLYLQETHKNRNRLQSNKLPNAMETPRTVLCGRAKSSAFGSINTFCLGSYQNAWKITTSLDLAERGI